MKAGTVIGFLLVAMLAFYVGYEVGGTKPHERTAQDLGQVDRPKELVKEAALVAGDVFNVPIGDAPCKGAPTAKVTIVEYSDFQCPFCSRVNPTLKQAQNEFGAELRICFKNNPLPFHKDAGLAAEAALAAHAQGKFWPFHDAMFANQKAIGRADLEKYAADLGLDLAKFKQALDDGTYKQAVNAQSAEAARLGSRGTPGFFINGVLLSGAQPYPKFKEAIEAGLARADAALAKGATRGDLYATLIKDGQTKAAAPQQPQRPTEGTGRKLVAYEAHNYCKGPAEAKVTIVEFSDFQCPFCSRVVPTIEQIVKTYPREVKVCFRHNPLPFHQHAALAAEAALAAGEQGKFWPYHDKLFANQKALERADLEGYAKELGLNMGLFKSALDKGTFKNAIAADQKVAQAVGARGTPSFFVNGNKIAGAQPFDAFKAMIDEDIKKADALIARGTAAKDVYAALVKAEPFKPGTAAPAQPEEDDKPVDVDIKNAYFKGPKDAPVVIATFSEFQCPFCKRVEPTIKQLMDEYGGKIRVAFMHNPLPFHKNAEGASKAALAAGEQGKFWEYHDKLFENQGALNPEALESYAEQLNLNMKKFKADMASPKIAALINADKAEAAKVGARGTPTFFINGRRLVGAQPIDKFKQIIDDELGKK